MGRSSTSCHHQLSADKLVSRVHVAARYVVATEPGQADRVELNCLGWNGMKIHCHGRTWDLKKGDSFTSETLSADILLDVHNSRVFVSWPESRRARSESESSWAGDEEHSSEKAMNGLGIMLESSPLRQGRSFVSPDSPTPARPATGNSLANLFSSPDKPIEDPDATFAVFEDADSDNEPALVDARDTAPFVDVSANLSSELSDEEDDANHNEENDPIVHSFGPFGANISARMASFKAAGTPEPESDHGSRQSSAPSSPSPAKCTVEAPAEPATPKPYVNHVVNQLAFSRLSSTPLSVILTHLPSELKVDLGKKELHDALVATPAVGEIRREGKDAAGQPLESEFYYIPDNDDDEGRRATVVDGLRKPSLRNCRKSHKVCFESSS